ncbi:hypothetical protein [Marinifilum caeruleilacunae]|uniref:LytTR family transcriptional regulator n=1 Tax=Marinifilum caeruleilacunae TaxID=2499076 RepID=A0ABX1X207_9BACT|nr:hypothetical protein [Marinifilum caeruleilacunae]NOU62271.1 hypothetical protein [Marinifilum caeruleilacunae]
MQINYNNIIFIIGNTQSCFVFNVDSQVLKLERSLLSIYKEVKSNGFVQINDFALINAMFVVRKHSGRRITLKGGSIHKVSRKFWKYFDDMPA